MRKIFSGSTLKIIAVICMVIDHIGQVVLKNGIALNATYSTFTDQQFSIILSSINYCHIIGRIAFPIFCFLLVEGFVHTHNLKRYCLNLGLFALISEPVYDLANVGKLISSSQQNVLFTLLLGVIVISIIRRYSNPLITILAIIIGSYMSYIFNFDGWYYGILLISAFYVFYDKIIFKYIVCIVVMFVCGLDFTFHALIDPYFIMACISLIFISAYNGERGIKMKYFFYVFYPTHLAILFIISSILIKCLS